MKTTGNKIIVIPEEDTETTENGIILIESSRTKPKTGKIVAIGDAARNHYREGMMVSFNRFSGTEFEHEGQTYIQIHPIDVIGIIQ